MGHRERFFKALRLEQPDRVPYFDIFDEESILKIGKHFVSKLPKLKYSVDYTLDEIYKLYNIQFEFMKELEIDAIMVGFFSGIKRIPGTEDLIKDRYGIVYKLSKHGESVVVDGPVKNENDLRKFRRMRPAETDFALLEYAREREPERVSILSIVDTFKCSWRLLGGMENLLHKYVTNPDFCLKIARITTDYLKEVIEIAVDKGAEIIFMEGDLAYTPTTMMSPDHFRKFIKPFYDEICEAAHKRDVPIIKHSDGNIWLILDDLMESGFDGFHPFQPQSMDIKEAKEYLKGKACVLGNIDCANLLPFGTEEEVIASVKDTIRKVAPDGGYILTSSNSIHPGCRGENVIAMFRAAQRYGKYPIEI